MKWTQRETMHMIGEGFSHMAFDVFADGQPTGIQRNCSTDGRPHFHKTSDIISCGDKFFDVLDIKGIGLTEWLTERRHEANLVAFDSELKSAVSGSPESGEKTK